MKTRCPVSTISYNSDNWLRATLDQLLADRKIDFWCFINHAPDTDDEKPHKHVYCILNHSLDTDVLRDFISQEPDENSDILGQKLGCIWFNVSKSFDDWYLYGLHHPEYLKNKGLDREHHYHMEDFRYSDRSAFRHMVSMVDVQKYSPFHDVIQAVETGKSFSMLIKGGKIRKQDLVAMSIAYTKLAEAK